MRSLRLLTLWTGLLVLVPAAVLAWLGLRGATGDDGALDLRLRGDLEAAERGARSHVARVEEELQQRLDTATDALARRLERRLPLDGFPAAVAEARRGPLTVLGDVPIPILALRVVDGAGTGLWPVVHEPRDARMAAPTGEALLLDLRRAADQAFFAEGDPEAARAVWRDARSRFGAGALQATAEVELALVDALAAGEGARASARESAARLEAVWGSDRLDEVGRPWLRLLLRGEDAERLAGSAHRGALDAVPLTTAEREAARALAGTRPVPPGGARTLEAELARGARLQVDVDARALRAAFARAVARAKVPPRTRVVVEAPTPGEASPSWVRRSGLVAERVVPFDGPTGGATLRLIHTEVDELVDERRTRRRMAAVGAVSLLLLMGSGLVLVRRAVLRERAARRLRDDFIANVSHELRTPLTSVCLHAELLAEDGGTADDTVRRSHAEVVRAQGARLAALVDDLLDFAALERGARRLEPEPVDVSRAVREAAAPYETLAAREGATLRVDAGEEVVAMADPGALARILANLLANAWRHGRPSRDGHPGRITVRATGGVDGATVDVADDGPGVAHADREVVFERFHRGQGATRGDGAGIGLSLSRDLASAMGGELALAGAEAETVFRLTLPGLVEETA